jgi:allantoinase
MADLDLLIRGRRVVGPDGIRRAAVGVQGGQIVIVEPYDTHLSAAATAELAADGVLLPGLVDTHVHINEPGRTDWEGFATATRPRRPAGSPRSSTCR